MQRPYIQFYTSDYLNDLNLRRCHPAAQGIWVRMLCEMAQGVPYGHLKAESLHGHQRTKTDKTERLRGTPPAPPRGTPPAPPDALPRGVPGGLLQDLINVPKNGSLEPCLYLLVGFPKRLVQWAVRHLEERDVFSRTADGIIYSRRMVRDEEKHRLKVERGHKAFEKRLRTQKQKSQRQTPPPLQAPRTAPATGAPAPPPGTPGGIPPTPPRGTPGTHAADGAPAPPHSHNQSIKKISPPNPPSLARGGEPAGPTRRTRADRQRAEAVAEISRRTTSTRSAKS